MSSTEENGTGGTTRCFSTHRTGRESCCSSTTGNNLSADDAGLRGKLSKFYRSEAYCTLCNCMNTSALQGNATCCSTDTRIHTLAYSFTRFFVGYFVPHIKKYSDCVRHQIPKKKKKKQAQYLLVSLPLPQHQLTHMHTN